MFGFSAAILSCLTEEARILSRSLLRSMSRHNFPFQFKLDVAPAGHQLRRGQMGVRWSLCGSAVVYAADQAADLRSRTIAA
jgi:hypothetical protein